MNVINNMTNDDEVAKLLKQPIGKTVTMPCFEWGNLISESEKKGYKNYSVYIREIIRQRHKLNLESGQTTLKIPLICIKCGLPKNECSCKKIIKKGYKNK